MDPFKSQTATISMDLSMTGTTERSERGRYPSISVNNKGTVVEMHQRAGYRMFYSVGVMNSTKTAIFWGEAIYMEEHGSYPRVTLNDSDTVIEVHESSGLARAVWYRHGKVNLDTKKINWESKSTRIDDGRYPAVALNNDGKVVIVYERAFFSYETYYWVGNVQEYSPVGQKIQFIGEKSHLFVHARNGVNELSVAMNGKEYLIAAGRSSNHKLVYRVGKFNENNSINWQTEVDFDIEGNYPSVALDDSLRVISIQQSFALRKLSYRVGKISGKTDGSHTLSWFSEQKVYDYGTLPVIAVSNDGATIVEEHETNFAVFDNKLYSRICNFK